MKTMIEYNNVLSDIIFPSFIRSCVPNVDLKELEKECYLIQEKEQSIKASNNGGYHSETRKNTEECEHKNFNQLIKIIRDFSQDTANYYDLGINLTNVYWWININKSSDYNFLHHHYRADMIGVFYISIPNKSGDLTLLRKDGSEYGNLYLNRKDMLTMSINGEVGRFYLIPGHLWHYVKANESQENRISLSCNIYF